MTVPCDLCGRTPEYITEGKGDCPDRTIGDGMNLNVQASMNIIIRNLKRLHELNCG